MENIRLKAVCLFAVVFYAVCAFPQLVVSDNILYQINKDLNSASILGLYDKSIQSQYDLKIPNYIKYNSEIFEVNAIEDGAFQNNVVLTSVSFVSDTIKIDNNIVEGEGTADKPYSVYQLSCLYDINKIPTDKIYVWGIVSKIADVDTGSYGNATYYISDDGSTSGQFEIYRGYSLNGEKFTSNDQLQVGDTVIVYGTAVLYNGKTREISVGSQLYYSSRLGKSDDSGGIDSDDDTPTVSSIENGGFEIWTDGKPNNWSTTSVAGNATLSKSFTAHSGNYSVCVAGTTSANKRLAYKEINLETGSYTMTFYAKAESTTACVRPGYVPVKSDGSVGSYVYGEYTNDISVNEWVKVSHEFTIYSNTTLCLVIMNSKNPGGNVLIDDVTLTKHPSVSSSNENAETNGYIGASAFSGCSGLKSITIPNSITSIGNNAFHNCTNLDYVKLPGSLVEIGQGVFSGCNPLSNEWEDNKAISMNFKVNTIFDTETGVEIKVGDAIADKNGIIELKNLRPNTYYSLPCELYFNGLLIYSATFSFNTTYLCKINKTINNPTQMDLSIDFVNSDVKYETVAMYNPITQEFENGTTVHLSNLTPNHYYEIGYYVVYGKGENDFELYTEGVVTPTIILKSELPKVVNSTCAVVSATTNIPDDEVTVGFEWRKTDAPDVVPSKEGGAVIYNGIMEGRIMNLSSDSYYKVRPYYDSVEGNRSYGDWIGFDPSDFSYFEPVVHTFEMESEPTNNNVKIKGYAVAGTDDIIEQGFEYKEEGATVSLPKTIKATGQLMTVTLEGLKYNTKYSVRAYVKTSEKTVYGETITFTTPITDGIEEITVDGVPSKMTDGIYDLQGRKVNRPSKGIYIVNGKKVLIK